MHIIKYKWFSKKKKYEKTSNNKRHFFPEWLKKVIVYLLNFQFIINGKKQFAIRLQSVARNCASLLFMFLVYCHRQRIGCASITWYPAKMWIERGRNEVHTKQSFSIQLKLLDCVCMSLPRNQSKVDVLCCTIKMIGPNAMNGLCWFGH